MAAFCAPHIGGIDANRTVKDEIVAAISRRSVRRRIAVTDLINPRQKFFERGHPEIQPSPERQQAMLAGTGFHETFGRAVSTEEYVEQLGMYCTMVDRPAGHLLYYVRAEYGRQAELAAFDLEFTDATAIAREMVRLRDLLREALNSGRPDRLPRCTWYGRGCDFAEVCGCSSAEPLIRAVSPQTVRVAANPALARRLLEGLGRQPPAPELSLNDLVFPRKAAFRRAPGAEEEEPDAAQRLVSLQRQGFDQVLGDAVWYGFPGQVRRLPVVLGPVRASVLLFKEAPTVLRTRA